MQLLAQVMLGLESDGNLTYNPSTGRLTATQLAGTLQTRLHKQTLHH